MKVAHKAYEWNKDKHVYFYVFVKLLQSGERSEAMGVLHQNFALLPFDRVTRYIPSEERVDAGLNEFYQKAFVEMERVGKELALQKHLGQFEYFQRVEELMEARNEHFVVREDSECSRCSRKILQYPFYYLPRSRQLIHYFCFNKESSSCEGTRTAQQTAN